MIGFIAQSRLAALVIGFGSVAAAQAQQTPAPQQPAQQVQQPAALQSSLRATETVNGRIVGGKPVEIVDYPWQVAVKVLEPGNSFSRCSGSVVAPGWVLTAAHCVSDTVDGKTVVKPKSDILIKSGKDPLVRRRLAARRPGDPPQGLRWPHQPRLAG